MNKIKKKVHEDIGLEDLRKVLPYEEFLKRALEDENSDSSVDEEYIENTDERTDSPPDDTTSYEPSHLSGAPKINI